jgi:GT2 family glycosyltransferase
MTAERDPVVSVIVVRSGQAGELRRCLRALLDTGYPALELIVVDDGSGDTAGMATSFASVMLVRSPASLDVAGATNLGLAHATGEYVALVAQDTVVAPGWIRELVRFLETYPDAAAAGGKAHRWSDRHPAGDGRNPYASYATIDPATCFARTWHDTPDEVREVATLSACAIMLRRRAIDEAGPVFLEPEFTTCYQETDLFARLLVRGWRLYYTGTPAVWHRDADPDPGRHRRDLFHVHRNRALFAYRNLGPEGLRALLRRRRDQDLFDRLRVRLGPLLPANPLVEARREAQRWIDEHLELLERHRAGAEHTRDERWAAAVRLAQAGGASPDRATRPPPGPGRAGSTPAGTSPP